MHQSQTYLWMTWYYRNHNFLGVQSCFYRKLIILTSKNRKLNSTVVWLQVAYEYILEESPYSVSSPSDTASSDSFVPVHFLSFIRIQDFPFFGILSTQWFASTKVYLVLNYIHTFSVI